MRTTFDIIHDHLAPVSLPGSQHGRTPLSNILRAFDQGDGVFQMLRTPYIVTISHSQGRHEGIAINHAGVILNGLSMRSYPFGSGGGDYLLLVGRISMQKRDPHFRCRGQKWICRF